MKPTGQWLLPDDANVGASVPLAPLPLSSVIPTFLICHPDRSEMIRNADRFAEWRDLLAGGWPSPSRAFLLWGWPVQTPLGRGFSAGGWPSLTFSSYSRDCPALVSPACGETGQGHSSRPSARKSNSPDNQSRLGETGY